MTPKQAVERSVTWTVDFRDGTWWVRSDKGSAFGCDTMEKATNQMAIKIMFDALELIDRNHDWHEYDWHTLTGNPLKRVKHMLAWRKEADEARATVAPFHAIASAISNRT